MMTISEFARALGRKEMAEALGVGATAISNAVVAEAFPASWFDTLEALAKAKGVECPRALFSWRKAEAPSDAA